MLRINLWNSSWISHAMLHQYFHKYISHTHKRLARYYLTTVSSKVNSQFEVKAREGIIRVGTNTGDNLRTIYYATRERTTTTATDIKSPDFLLIPRPPACADLL